MQNLKIITCPHTKKEVLAMYFEGERDGVKDYLCLHNEDPKHDEIEVNYFKEHNKRISEEELFSITLK